MGKMLFYFSLRGYKSSDILSESKSEGIQFASIIAKIICSEMFQNELKFKFEGHFPKDCQKDSAINF